MTTRAFVLDKDAFERLPKKEKLFFKPAVMNYSVQDGRLQRLYWVFFPYDVEGPRFKTEDELLAAVPVYAKSFLIPRREELIARRSLTRTDRKDWWGAFRKASDLGLQFYSAFGFEILRWTKWFRG